jgi:hypothetical protein
MGELTETDIWQKYAAHMSAAAACGQFLSFFSFYWTTAAFPPDFFFLGAFNIRMDPNLALTVFLNSALFG